MEQRELHLISNAHIDPMWQWEWEEGACEALSTFRVAAKFCRTFDGYIFCHNESILYKWVEEYEPALFREIQELVKLGKWHIMGGWHVQPDCNMPSGEGFVRNMESGRRYFMEKFGVAPTTAINFDPFGHTRGLVQILAKSGYDSYMFCRPNQTDCPLPGDVFTWVGYDGSEVLGLRSPYGYNSPRGNAVTRVNNFVNDQKELGVSTHFCLWGVGNHGGGPSFKDITDINGQMDRWAREEGVRVFHSTPEAFAQSVRDHGIEPPRHMGDLNTWAPGCYTSQVRIKQKYRELENALFVTEKMCSQLAATTDFVYPEGEIGEALYDLLTAQFHDALPGSSIQPVEDMVIRVLDHGLEILSRLKARAFFRLAGGQKPAAEGEIPMVVYNPHPYEVEGDFECEFMLADQNWREVFTSFDVVSNGQIIPSQVEKENSNIPIDWRKRVAFHARLAPMQVSRFDCRLRELERKPVPTLPVEEDHYLFQNGVMEVAINRKTGLLDRVLVNGKSMLAPGAMSIRVYKDNEDPWGMTVNGWGECMDRFTLLSPEEGSRLSSLSEAIPSVRVIEDGTVRTVVEAVFGYSTSRAVVRYKLSKVVPVIDLEIRIINSDTQVMYKLAVPCRKETISVVSEVAFGEEPAKADTRENVMQRYLRASQGNDRSLDVNLYNRGTYGYSVEDNQVLVTLMRSPAYLAHPIDNRKTLPQDRHSPYIEQGERLFDLRLTFGQEENAKIAQAYNEKPMILSFFPAGDGEETAPPVLILDGESITLCAMKKAVTQPDAFVLRLFNHTGEKAFCRMTSKPMMVEEAVEFGPFEIKSFLLQTGKLTETDLLENPSV